MAGPKDGIHDIDGRKQYCQFVAIFEPLRGRTVRCARAVRKVGHSPPPVGSFLGYKGRLHSHVPFIGRKTLTMRQKTYNDVHGYYRARVEHLFAHLWSWRVVRDIWLGSHQDLHANTRILLHFSQFMLRRQKRYQPYGPWEHIPSSIWTEEEAPEVDEEEEDTFLCQVCGKRDTSECSTCDL